MGEARRRKLAGTAQPEFMKQSPRFKEAIYKSVAIPVAQLQMLDEHMAARLLQLAIFGARGKMPENTRDEIDRLEEEWRDGARADMKPKQRRIEDLYIAHLPQNMEEWEHTILTDNRAREAMRQELSNQHPV